MNADLEGIIAQVKNLARQGNREEAFALAQGLIGRFPDEMEAWLLNSYLHARSGRYEEAIPYVTKAIERNDKEPSLFYDRGRYYLALGDNLSAIEDFRSGLALCESFQNDYYRESLHFHRAEARLRSGRKREALEDLEHVREEFSCWTDKLRTKAELIEQGKKP
jgi:tetratricopeptide (TPR) repeat protein